MKKILISVVGMLAMSGCADFTDDKIAYIEGNEDIDFVIEKEIYTCGEDEFFFIEKSESKTVLNFMYGSYSMPLSQKPSLIGKIFSDGIYNISFNNDIANVVIGEELILENCKKTI